MKKYVLLFLAVAVLASCSEDGQVTAPPVAVVEPEVVKPPSHYYVIRDELEYGYEQEVSKDARDQGQAASKVMMIKFLGERDGKLQFHSKEGSFHVVLECATPCEYIKQMFFYNGEFQRKEHIHAVEGSIAWAMIQDGVNGQLEQYTKQRDGKLSELWVSESGLKWRPVVATGS